MVSKALDLLVAKMFEKVGMNRLLMPIPIGQDISGRNVYAARAAVMDSKGNRYYIG
jgi:hypothetical protein